LRNAEQNMLTDEMKKRIEAECDRCGNRQGACIEAIQAAQTYWGWISDENLEHIARFLGMTPSELDGVASFYNHIYRRPVGKYIIMVCDSVSCWVMGYEKLLEHMTAQLGIKIGGTTEDGLFTLLPIQCLGACDRAPAMMIDEALYTELTPEKFDEIIRKYREGA
jgi:NADH-quinone oxidoreductase subunit E